MKARGGRGPLPWRGLLPAAIGLAAWCVVELALLAEVERAAAWRAAAFTALGGLCAWCEQRAGGRDRVELALQLDPLRARGARLGARGLLLAAGGLALAALAAGLARAALPPEAPAPDAAGGVLDALGAGLASALGTLLLGRLWTLRAGDAVQDRARDHAFALPAALLALGLAAAAALEPSGAARLPGWPWTAALGLLLLAAQAELARRRGTDLLPRLSATPDVRAPRRRPSH